MVILKIQDYKSNLKISCGQGILNMHHHLMLSHLNI